VVADVDCAFGFVCAFGGFETIDERGMTPQYFLIFKQISIGKSMSFTLDLANLIQILAVSQGFIFAFLLCRRACMQGRYSDYWLAGLMLVLSAYMWRYVMADIDPTMVHYDLIRLLAFSYYLIGVVIYFYLKTQINVQYRLSRKDLWHFLPIFIYFILFLIHSVEMNRHGGKWERPLFFDIMGWGFLIYRSVGTIVYWFLSWRLYQNYRAWLPTERSDTEGVKFRWFGNMLTTVGILVFSGISLNLFDNFVMTTPVWLDTLQELVIAYGIYYLSLAGYLQYQPERLVYQEPIEIFEIFKDKETTQNPTILMAKMSMEETQEWKNKILTLVEKERLYLNPELTLTDLAQRLQTHSKLVSAVINDVFEKNFNDFINDYRVNLFKEKVNDPKLKHLTLLAIGFECGFNSKSTFNRAVKRATGEMPSAFVV
jgi:AraC-like DNA-binding protein